MVVALPGDILYMIFDLLKAEKDYNTIYQCAVSSRLLAEPALMVLYQLYDTSPVTGGDPVDKQWKQRRFGVSIAGLKNEQDVVVRKWALMWRSIILSTFGRTYLPYYSYIRCLNLTDLTTLLHDHRFTGKIRDEFFSREIEDYVFHDYEPKGSKRLRSSRSSQDVPSVVEKLGSAIASKAKLIRELRGEVSPSRLIEWIPGLPQLETLSIWSGNALSQQAGEEIGTHCPKFKRLTVYMWLNGPTGNAESESEQFLNSLQPHTLEYFELIGHAQLGPRSIRAIGAHLNSLTELKLTNLDIEPIAELPSLTAPQALKVLSLTDSRPAIRDENFYKIVSNVADWLASCRNLRQLELRKFLDDPVLLSRALVDGKVRLTRLSVRGYTMSSARAFHEVLASQSSLQCLYLQGEGSEVDEDQAVLVQALGQLNNLRELDLKDISDYFTPDHVATLTPFLPKLEQLTISGYNFNDEVWNSLLCLPKLKNLVIHAFSEFTAHGILDFISQLGPDNEGFNLSILNATSDAYVPAEARVVIRDTLARNVDGTFDFELAREEYTESEGDED